MSFPARAFLIFVLVACGDDAAPPTQGGTTSLDESTTAPDESTTTPDESTTAPDGTTIGTGGTELDCAGVFDCVALCPDGDDPCVEACVASASAEAIVLVEAVLACAEANGCVDEDCLATNCSAEVLACAGADPTDTEDTGEPACDPAGKPEMTGPITGLQASYPAGDPIDVSVPVDEDTARVIVGVYEVGSKLYLGGTAEDVEGPGAAALSFFAGVVGGETGEFYLAVELCSTSVCTTPFVRNTYDRVDRTAPLGDGETYVQTREFVGNPAMPETCPTEIPIQSFLIE